jgi:2-(1,2-epoxy-1,2-dihydrophenyl)acetyl-CoA isomerase
MADVEFKHENSVLWITLNRPEMMGAMSNDMRAAILERVYAARTDLDVRAVVITGRGKGFCSGADLSRPAGAPEPVRTVGGTRETLRTGMQVLLKAIWELEKPVIAAVNGTAAGLGAHLAFVCDLIIAAEGARFIEVFVRRGIGMDAVGGFLLPRVMPLAKAKELVFFGDALTAEDALPLGIVNKVVPADQLEATAREWAERVAQGPTFAIGASKRLLNRGTETGLESCLEREADLQSLVVGSEDAEEGMKAFRERRTPTFRGR